MAHVVNTSLVDPFTFLDTANAVVTGKVNGDFTKAAYLVSSPATTATVTIAAASGQSGDYTAAFTPTVVGRWKCKVSCTHEGYTYRWEETFEVVTAAQADPLNALVSPYATGTAGHRLARIGAGSTLVAAPVAESGDVRIYKGDDYAVADGTALEWQLTGAPDLTGATVTLTITSKSVALPKICTLDDEGETTQLVFAELTDAQTDTLSPSEVTRYVLRAVLAGGSVATLATGRVTVVDE